ncbi:hypothetical protein K3757_15170 [Sulfitobacter sp. S223]|uniref:hypothetical protein n=1 Tax=Sulfitobacter sp. S223 TaxID=2867023 RepID=UPI0021A33C0C|nr:hypothetical protein [Sulfitobacter sp. S223]UWR25783.1 hypothetical protein K3757_15170 [Sulfitobacter sp. S223]
MADENETQLTTEKVAYWYFRLNGYLQMENFIVHPEKGGGQRTDADLIGVRFPHRQERFYEEPDNVMQDDLQALELTDGWIDVVIVEVKTNAECTLNGPWTNKDAQNVQRVLAAIGCLDPGRLEEAAARIYDRGLFEDDNLRLRVRLVAIGASTSDGLKHSHPQVTQLTWHTVLGFIGDRLYGYRKPKNDSHQWDEQIALLKNVVIEAKSGHEFERERFIALSLERLGIRAQKPPPQIPSAKAASSG